MNGLNPHLPVLNSKCSLIRVARRARTRYCPANRQSGGLTMADTNPNYSTPSAVRSVTSYPARRGFKQAVDPSVDHVVGVEDAIDIHCHAHEGQQDALGVAKLASKSGMKGILYKTIVGRKDPAGTVSGVRGALESWCAERNLTPAQVWPGSSVT